MRDLAGSITDQRENQGARGMVKTEVDLLRYEKLLADLAPVAWCIEAGTFSGISARWLADTAHCQVATIDNHPQATVETRAHPDVTWITGDSASPEVVAYVTSLVAGAHGNIVVILDSDHSADHVYAEMCAYADLVTVASYLVVEDTIVRWLPEQLPFYKDSSPLDAVERFLAERDDFVTDQVIEDMLPTTQSPGGWLRRIA